MPRTLIALAIALLILPACRAGAQDDMHGKVFVGYQGWFAPAKVAGTWRHYGAHGRFEPGHCVIDMWPDVSEFDPDELFPTDFRHADGRVAHVFNSADSRTVARHFRWMKQYGIDGAFVQRFGVSLRHPAGLQFNDTVLGHVRRASAEHGRRWAVMYDLSGLDAAGVKEHVAEDWKRLVRDDNIRSDAMYLRHNGRPVVAVWGVGFNDGRNYAIADCLELVRFLKTDPQFGNNTVIVGVPYWWRTLRRDAVDDARLHELVRLADVIMPWSVGRYGTPATALERQADPLAPDLAWAHENKLDYLPVIFPGFSWHNLEKARGRDAKLDAIPRLGGAFLWAQALAARRAGASMVYVAMFDEIDEATAIFKVTNDPPVGSSPFVTYQGLPSDHYLWLTGEIGQLMRQPPPAGDAMPERGAKR